MCQQLLGKGMRTFPGKPTFDERPYCRHPRAAFHVHIVQKPLSLEIFELLGRNMPRFM
jgi:hypothetical protein